MTRMTKRDRAWSAALRLGFEGSEITVEAVRMRAGLGEETSRTVWDVLQSMEKQGWLNALTEYPTTWELVPPRASDEDVGRGFAPHDAECGTVVELGDDRGLVDDPDRYETKADGGYCSLDPSDTRTVTQEVALCTTHADWSPP